MVKEIILGVLSVVFTGAIFFSMLNVYPLAVIFFGVLLWCCLSALVG